MKNLLLAILLATNMLTSMSFGADTFTTKDYGREAHSLGVVHSAQSRGFLELKKSTARWVFKAPQAAIPGKYDLTPRVSPPEQQGGCGSCWSFGITKALRSALMLGGKDPGTLSFNDLVHNCFPSHKQWGCQGGNFDAGESFLNGQGPGLESGNPYNASSSGACSKSVAGTALEYKLVGSGNTAPTFQELADALSKNHMLVVDVAVCGSWGSYSSGIFNQNQCGANSINHIININGYDCQSSVDASGSCVFNSKGQPANGDGYLIAMNNWGTNWGEGGYMRSRWGMDALADTAMYFEVKQVPTPTPTPSPTPSPIPPSPEPVPPTPFAIPWQTIGIIAGLLMGLAALVLVFVKKG